MNPENTYAFLIAVQKYPNDQGLPPLPHSWENVKALYDVFKGKSIGIPKSNFETVLDPEDSKILTETLQRLVKKDNAETIIIYYSGHGILDDDGSHYLTLKNSTVGNIGIDGLDINYMNKAFKNSNINIILILDSCFSEKSFESFKARNYLLLASSAKNRTSIYPVDADFSAFTNELITIFKGGIDNGNSILTWKDVYSQLKLNLKNKNLPLPRISSANEVDMLEIGINNFNNTEVILDSQWVKIIKEDMGKDNPKFRNKVTGILNSGSEQMEARLIEHLVNQFPFPIAFYLNKLFDKKATSETYFQLYESIISFLFMVGFIEYESVKLTAGFESGNKFKQRILNFDEPDHDFYFSMLEALSTDFRDNKTNRFIEEFNYFDPNFQSAIQNLETQRQKKDSAISAIRGNIIKLITQLDFLFNYKLLSVKDVSLSYRKYDPLLYKHSVSLLQGTGLTQYEVWEQAEDEWQQSFVKNAEAKNNRSVLFVKCKDPKNIEYKNLWPMIIDKNVLEARANMPLIYIYAGKDQDGLFLYKNIRDLEELGTTTYDDLEALETDTAVKKEKINELFAK